MIRIPFILLVTTMATATEIDPALPEYVPVAELRGALTSIGSAGLNNLMTLWAEEFAQRQPGMNIQIEGNGGSTAPAALIGGYSHIGTMSRPFNDKEVAAFTTKYGYPPTAIEVAIEALAVFVHRDNPISNLTLTDLDRIYSSTRRRGGVAATTWGDLGLVGDWSALPLDLHGRNSASGTYGYFKMEVLQRGDFLPTLKEQPGSTAVVNAVSASRGGIGHTGCGYVTDAVRLVPLADGNRPAVLPIYAACLDNSYPLVRRLYLYINRKPGMSESPVHQFIKFVLSKPGQAVVVKDGYFPLSPALAAEQRKKLE